MKTAAQKLQLRPGTRTLLLALPAYLQPLREELAATVALTEDAVAGELGAALVFVTAQREIDALAPPLAAQAPGDAALWFAYPKGTAKRYRCDFNRDTGWAALGAAGFEPVSQVALDAEWSALRFRRVEYIRQFRRGGAISAAGQARLV
ncbi:hypothetical protein [Hymenobacter sp. B81]|uniref:hypothetical protein n=1 Tax=Hymenobacter sp. B81 TaxID=3344878 RepID=UPI0037DC880A